MNIPRVLRVAAVAWPLLFHATYGQAEVEHASSGLITLAEEFREFRSPVFRSYKTRDSRTVTEAPDYAAVVQEQLDGLPRFQQRLRNMDPQDWPTHDQIDYLLLRAEMDFVDDVDLQLTLEGLRLIWGMKTA